MAEVVYTSRPYYSYPGAFAARVINVIVGLVELLLALRFVLELLGANSGAAFVAWVYSASGNLVAPFAGAFPSISIGTGLIDIPTVLAMIAYAILGWLIIRLVYFVFGAI